MTIQPSPGRRVGHAERDAAVDRLQAHFAAGRLDTTEFDERVQAALEAKVEDDLLVLFRDLPEDPQQSVLPALAPAASAGTPTPAPTKDEGDADGDELFDPTEPVAAQVVRFCGYALFPLAMVAMIGLRLWWVFLLACFIGPALGSLADSISKRDKLEQRRRWELER